ncbi:AAA family ATPase [Schaalia suimastitidis]|uniref:AAA family ATPase n=1 Tax=Schaalia suimastitidis TaxID=121163 RepID=UPI00040F581E|nr:MoxR family ATPase [Schaalia suimastitidis]
MTVTAQDAQWFAGTFTRVVDNVATAVLGKENVIRLALTCMFAEGHLLLEDAPGTGKTALARAIAASVAGTHSRIQFTPDLLPSDITGVTIYDQEQKKWDFHRGPIFASIVLADEINRASPKTQSALLEVMEESRVTVDGVRHETGRPFMVIATQNPVEQAGTYKLPEAQLDRFLMKTQLGYPDHASGMSIILGAKDPDRSKNLESVIDSDTVIKMLEMAADNYLDPIVADYVQSLCEATRADSTVRIGVSTRGAIGMVRSARVWALAQGRQYVTPHDISVLAERVWAHRIVLDPDAEFVGATRQAVIQAALSLVPAPSARN